MVTIKTNQTPLILEMDLFESESKRDLILHKWVHSFKMILFTNIKGQLPFPLLLSGLIQQMTT